MSKSKRPEDEAKKPAPAGRVKHDATGRAIWEWAAETGRHAIESTSHLLKRLEMPGLKLEEDAKREQEEKEAAEADKPPPASQIPSFGGPKEKDPLAGARKSFNPYDNKAPPPKRVPPKPAAAARPVKPAQPQQPQARPGFFARLFGRKS